MYAITKKYVLKSIATLGLLTVAYTNPVMANDHDKECVKQHEHKTNWDKSQNHLDIANPNNFCHNSIEQKEPDRISSGETITNHDGYAVDVD